MEGYFEMSYSDFGYTSSDYSYGGYYNKDTGYSKKDYAYGGYYNSSSGTYSSPDSGGK